MKFSHLEQIIVYLQRFTQITKAYRLTDTQICIEFDRDHLFTFEMRRSDPLIFISPRTERTKIYQAPFDVLLAKRLNRSDIQSITLHNNDKIIRITVTQNGAYKSNTTILQLEFTGKYTNAILVDEENIVLEALRHIDEYTSIRSVRVSEPLLDPPPPSFSPIHYPIDSLSDFLHTTYENYAKERLMRLKKEKITLISKRLDQYKYHQNNLIDETRMLNEADEAQHIGHLILANIHRIKGYETSIELDDFDGGTKHVILPTLYPDGAQMAQAFFKKSKKLKQKALGQSQERQNLEEKTHHLHLFLHTIEHASNPEEILILFPAKTLKSKQKSHDRIEEFWIDGIKVSLGKNEKGNIELLERSRARDIWLHLKDRPSAHVILTTDKQELPASIIEAAAKLCVDFSVFEKGSYLVDYTPRREVRIQEGAKVLYTNYKTLTIVKN